MLGRGGLLLLHEASYACERQRGIIVLGEHIAVGSHFAAAIEPDSRLAELRTLPG